MYGAGFSSLGVSLVALSLAIILSYIYMSSFNSGAPMANYGLLFVSNTAKTHGYFLKACSLVKKVLYININEKYETLPALSQQIVKIYSDATTHCSNLDVRLIIKSGDITKKLKTFYPIDLILYDSLLSKEVENLRHSELTHMSTCKLEKINIPDSQTTENHTLETVKTHEYVALGGTFDRLHNGHKILLSQAVLRSTKHLTVGVTDVSMIQSKKLWELIEPVEQRMKAVLNFLTDINPDLEYNVVPIQDMFGPTKDDPKIQMIVVSEETAKAVAIINEKRQENGLNPLDSYVIELAADSHPQRSHEEETKVSSSNQRMRLLGTMLRPPQPNPSIPDWPYVIGLAGGIASGKSSIMKRLQAKGAAIVNCDFIAHDLYKPGLPLNGTLAETFGKRIITDTGEVDRKILGQIVFNDKTQLEKLNQLLWPAIMEEAERRVKALGAEGYKVVVMEAAVMVRARWYTRCHQLWTVIIPPAEAVKRLQERNSLTEEEARQRIESQPSNLEQVEHANIVFSPYWSYEYTQGQVDRAWELLQEHLENRSKTTSKM